MAHLHAELAGNLSEHASCCGHTQWWRNLNQRISDSERKPFAQPGTKKRYAPDLTVKVHHVKLVLAVDPVRKTLGGHCLTTIELLNVAAARKKSHQAVRLVGRRYEL